MLHPIQASALVPGQAGEGEPRVGDVSGCSVRLDVTGTGPYSDEIHTQPGLHALLSGRLGPLSFSLKVII